MAAAAASAMLLAGCSGGTEPTPEGSPGATTPWLAESVEWSDDFTSLTVVLRGDVTYRDGTPFTGDDIVYTFGQYLDGRLTDTSGLSYTGADVDGDTITLNLENSMYVRQATVLHTPIVPKHIWETLEDPGTEPLTGEGQVVGNWPVRHVELVHRVGDPHGPRRLVGRRTGSAAVALHLLR